jgi:hypothetical protein
MRARWEAMAIMKRPWFSGGNESVRRIIALFGEALESLLRWLYGPKRAKIRLALRHDAKAVLADAVHPALK